jgi:hypothetical protein
MKNALTFWGGRNGPQGDTRGHSPHPAVTHTRGQPRYSPFVISVRFCEEIRVHPCPSVVEIHAKTPAIKVESHLLKVNPTLSSIVALPPPTPRFIQLKVRKALFCNILITCFNSKRCEFSTRKIAKALFFKKA